MTPIVLLALTALFSLIGTFSFFFPGKNVNRFVGYRTARSMKSEEAWRDGNKMFGLNMTVFSLISFAVSLFELSFLASFGWLVIAFNLVFLIVGLFVVIVKTEQFLTKKYE